MRTSAEMERIRNNIQKIMTGYHSLTPIYNTTDQWDWQKANRWEQILSEIYNMMFGMRNWYVYGGVARGGQPRLWQHRFREYFSGVTYPSTLATESGENIITENGEELEADLI